jgi:hypothetical protein
MALNISLLKSSNVEGTLAETIAAWRNLKERQIARGKPDDTSHSGPSRTDGRTSFRESRKRKGSETRTLDMNVL